jgi:hypothetical protein
MGSGLLQASASKAQSTSLAAPGLALESSKMAGDRGVCFGVMGLGPQAPYCLGPVFLTHGDWPSGEGPEMSGLPAHLYSSHCRHSKRRKGDTASSQAQVAVIISSDLVVEKSRYCFRLPGTA